MKPDIEVENFVDSKMQSSTSHNSCNCPFENVTDLLNFSEYFHISRNNLKCLEIFQFRRNIF